MTDGLVGVIGGSGLYSYLADAEAIEVTTPYGAHSQGLTRGYVAGRELVFLPRHGLGHQLPPHVINYRANMWALESLGVEQILAPCAAGSLNPQLPRGSMVIPDQLVDRTTNRPQTFVDTGMFHIGFADPYCPVGRASLATAADRRDVPITREGVMVVIQGPRFSTRAESQAFSREGWSLINMTGMPEAVLARELAMCYSTLAVVTDLDAGTDVTPPVSQREAISVFAQNIQVLRDVLREAVIGLPHNRLCRCGDALQRMSTEHLPPDATLGKEKG